MEYLVLSGVEGCIHRSKLVDVPKLEKDEGQVSYSHNNVIADPIICKIDRALGHFFCLDSIEI